MVVGDRQEVQVGERGRADRGDLAAGQVPTLVIAVAAASAVVQVVVNPVLSCLLVTAYSDLRVRKEGFDLEVLASTLQPA